ncbi:MAG: ABC transporter substrate-binding protein [Saprospiraceae bacterium]|nr:ABC transporter substrate-binding protein [Saprospiraceae bacterium]
MNYLPVYILKGTLILTLTGLLGLSCSRNASDAPQVDPRNMPWEEVKQSANGQTVDLMMWMGDPQINTYMSQFVKPALQQQFGINLNIINGQGNTIVQTMLAEIQGGQKNSAIDLMWINGETFYQLRQINALWGPWTEKIPNAQYINFANPFIGIDFQQPVDGYECPWGNVQMALIYDSVKVDSVPASPSELLNYVKANPGTFTIDNQFTGLTFLKSLLINFAGGPKALDGPFDEDKYQESAAMLWSYLQQMKPYLWKEGKTYPEGVAPMHQMFATGELHFTMSNNDAEVDNKIRQGLFPSTARAYVWETGTIQNTHYMGITQNAKDKAAAMVAVNFLVSPEAQYEKMNPTVWGDGTILDLNQLPTEWQRKFARIPGRVHAPNRKDIQERALQELAPEYMIRLAKDFRTHMIN